MQLLVLPQTFIPSRSPKVWAKMRDKRVPVHFFFALILWFSIIDCGAESPDGCDFLIAASLDVWVLHNQSVTAAEWIIPWSATFRRSAEVGLDRSWDKPCMTGRTPIRPCLNILSVFIHKPFLLSNVQTWTLPPKWKNQLSVLVSIIFFWYFEYWITLFFCLSESLIFFGYILHCRVSEFENIHTGYITFTAKCNKIVKMLFEIMSWKFFRTVCILYS